MSFIKKVLVLKQIAEGYSINGKTISGIARIEVENGVATLYLSVINAAAVSGGNYYAFVVDENKTLYKFDLGKRPFASTKVFDDEPKFDSGFAIGLSYISDNLPILIAFAVADNIKIDKNDFKKLVIDHCLLLNKTEQKRLEREQSENIVVSASNPVNSPYNDEAVATENYYSNDEKIEEKLKVIAEKDDGYLRFQNALFNDDSKKEKNENIEDSDGAKNGKDSFDGETDFKENFERENRALNNTDGNFNNEEKIYYLTVKEELDGLFKKFPEEKSLTACLPFSKWAKVKYADDKYYVVGLVYEDKTEKYICYGVPAKYSASPPKELAGYCSFMPLSIFDMTGDGYWMLYQDAVTGDCVKMNASLY